MRRRDPLRTGPVILAAVLAVGGGVCGWIGLTALATPPDLGARLSHVRAQTEAAERLLADAGQADAYPIGAICDKPAGAAADAMRQSLRVAAAASGVTVSRLDVVGGQGDEALGGLAPVRVTLEGAGRYDQQVEFLKALSKLRPEVFVSQADLQSKVSSVALKLSGQAYCSPSARL